MRRRQTTAQISSKMGKVSLGGVATSKNFQAAMKVPSQLKGAFNYKVGTGAIMNGNVFRRFRRMPQFLLRGGNSRYGSWNEVA